MLVRTGIDRNRALMRHLGGTQSGLAHLLHRPRVSDCTCGNGRILRYGVLMPTRRRAAQIDLGQALRRLREAAGLTAAEVAVDLGWAESTVTRKETGSIRIKDSDLDRLLERYAVDGAERIRLSEMAHATSQVPTRAKDAHASGAVPRIVEDYIHLEATAAAIFIYAAIVVPGLLQTPEYANAIIGTTPVPEEEFIAPRMDVRMARQGALARRPPKLDVILDEAVLLRPIGGPEVMRAQTLRLIEMSERSHITLRVLPMAVGAHPALTGQFFILEFGAGKRPIVFSDGLTGGVLRDNAEAVQRHRACFEALSELASSEEDSLAFVQATAERFRA
jgi:transcriptional regulator with XRE-family HTH domain